MDPAQSGRLQLARWLTSPANPLAARVAVNRVWHHLFGQGLVATVDNFGVNGAPPSHPELLDHLAGEFVRAGWSVKKLVRQLVLSHAYRLGSETPALAVEKDPGNRLVWRHTPRRLDAEEVRDALLHASGRLLEGAGKPVVAGLRMVEMRDNGAEAKLVLAAATGARERSVYLPLLRGVTPASLEAFDPVEQTLVTGRRETTTVPTQALYLLNSGFVRAQSLALAERLLARVDVDAMGRISLAYQKVLGRKPLAHEARRALHYLTRFEQDYVPPAEPVEGVVTAAPVAMEASEAATAGLKPLENPDDVERGGPPLLEPEARPRGAVNAAWMTFVQALFASAEFRFVR